MVWVFLVYFMLVIVPERLSLGDGIELLWRALRRLDGVIMLFVVTIWIHIILWYGTMLFKIYQETRDKTLLSRGFTVLMVSPDRWIVSSQHT